ncbi:MAG: triose-phosphate isomerase [Steroidobacteraceae bacterium]
MRRKLVAGNWKMQGSRASAQALVAAIAQASPMNCEIAVFPPFPYLAELIAAHTNASIGFGAQDVSAHDKGAYTGEVAASMVKDIGARYTLVGHSERRQYHAESNEIVAQKYAQAQAVGLVPILCVGETLEQRDAGQTESVIGAQLDAVIARSTAAGLASAVIAYEPVWAIGTGRTATPEIAAAVHRYIRQCAADQFSASPASALRILYGGSVKPDNIRGLLAEEELDGALVGGASLDPKSFAAIVNAV